MRLCAKISSEVYLAKIFLGSSDLEGMMRGDSN